VGLCGAHAASERVGRRLAGERDAWDVARATRASGGRARARGMRAGSAQLLLANVHAHCAVGGGRRRTSARRSRPDLPQRSALEVCVCEGGATRAPAAAAAAAASAEADAMVGRTL